MFYQSAPAPTGGVSEVSTVRLRRAGERSGRKGGSINARRLDNRDYDRERRVRRWFEEAIIFCYRMTVRFCFPRAAYRTLRVFIGFMGKMERATTNPRLLLFSVRSISGTIGVETIFHRPDRGLVPE